MRHGSLAEEIAVLDGLEGALGAFGAGPADDGRIGQRPATGGEYARFPQHNVGIRRNVVDPSEGANYGGGSSYAPGLPLMPSAVGLAGFADADLMRYFATANVAPSRKGIVDPGGGALHTGGSSYAPGIPMLPSSQGLVGLDRADRYSEFAATVTSPVPLEAYFEGHGSSITIANRNPATEGRIGVIPASGHEYAKRLALGVEERRNVVDPTEGATYGGGSSYAPGLPLMPSTVGLAGLGRADRYSDFALGQVEVLDGLSDNAFTPRLLENQRSAFQRLAGKAPMQALKRRAASTIRAIPTLTPAARAAAQRSLRSLGYRLDEMRRMRRRILGLRPGQVVTSTPVSPSSLAAHRIAASLVPAVRSFAMP